MFKKFLTPIIRKKQQISQKTRDVYSDIRPLSCVLNQFLLHYFLLLVYNKKLFGQKYADVNLDYEVSISPEFI